MDFELRRGSRCLIRVDAGESEAVWIAARNLVTDLGKAMGITAEITQECATEGIPEILIGTVGIFRILGDQVDLLKLQDERGKFRKEAYLQTVCQGRLVIAGSDRRGTIYGIYDLCEALGVSPWYFWADVPVKEKDVFTLAEDYRKVDYPSVEYRGIFINDEEELEAWVQNYMGEGTIGVKTYEKIFELLLRLKGNYIWPAMHVNSFNVKQENGALAERMGMVVGTSHCDMLMRSNNREWKPWIAKKGYTDAKYDYSIEGRNREILQEYWRESVEQNKDFEVSYTLGMRGIHDSGFETCGLADKSPEEIRQAKVELLEQIIRDQEKILQDTLGRDTMKTFVPYKEVLELYDAGLEVPEDLTLVWTNDNYGYVRRYPSEKERHRKGGNGIYYHNSYWAPPSMSYVFLCSIPLAHTGNEMRKAYQEGIRKLWVINTGALKPLEQEISFYLQLAWDMGRENTLTEDVDQWVADWIDRTFSGGIGQEASRLLNDFSQLTNVRKLENMDYDAFSQTAYGDEAAVRIHAYEELFTRGNALYEELPDREKSAFFQMVLFRIHAAYFTNLQYYYGDRSTLMYERGAMQAAALYTQKAQELDDARRALILYYNQILENGKWNGIVNPEGFPPPRAAMMPVCTPPIRIGKRGMRVDLWNDAEKLTFVNRKEKWIEISNLGEGSFDYEIQAPEWITLSEDRGSICTEQRILVRVKDGTERQNGQILVWNRTDDQKVEIPVSNETHLPQDIHPEEDGQITVDADSVDCQGTGFRMIKRLGRGRGDLVEADTRTEGKGLSYPVTLAHSGTFTLELHRFPSLNSTGRLRIGVSVDQEPQVVLESIANDEWRGNWKANVLNNVDRLTWELPRLEAGTHTITFYPIDKYFAFSRFVIYTAERKPNNYIGIPGEQGLPKWWNTREWLKQHYGDIRLKPRPVEYAQLEKEIDDLAVTDVISQEEQYAAGVEPEWYLEQGSSPFAEADGAIKIDAASALAQSTYAYTSHPAWQHCRSESYGRTGLAMYIRQRDLKWERANAPALHYTLQCEGGTYMVWILAKFGIREESYMGLGLDGRPIPETKLYGKGCLWRYEAEQIYRWIPMASLTLEKGEHELEIRAMASGMRYDRIYLTKGQELPPADGEWIVNYPFYTNIHREGVILYGAS